MARRNPLDIAASDAAEQSVRIPARQKLEADYLAWSSRYWKFGEAYFAALKGLTAGRGEDAPFEGDLGQTADAIAAFGEAALGMGVTPAYHDDYSVRSNCDRCLLLLFAAAEGQPRKDIIRQLRAWESAGISLRVYDWIDANNLSGSAPNGMFESERLRRYPGLFALANRADLTVLPAVPAAPAIGPDVFPSPYPATFQSIVFESPTTIVYEDQREEGQQAGVQFLRAFLELLQGRVEKELLVRAILNKAGAQGNSHNTRLTEAKRLLNKVGYPRTLSQITDKRDQKVYVKFLDV